MRNDFESWASSRGQPLLRQGEGYASERTGMAWKAWKNSRVSAVEKLKALGLAPAVLEEIIAAISVDEE